MSQSAQKFLFNTSFEGGPAEKVSDAFQSFGQPKQKAPQKAATPEPQAAEPEVQEAPPPGITEEELEAARQAAYAEGIAAGRAEAEAQLSQSLEAALAQGLGNLTASLQQMTEQQRASIAKLQDDALRLSLTAVRTLFPTLERTTADAEVERVFRECLERLPNEPRVVIRVADDLLDNVQSRLQDVADKAGFSGHLVFLSEPQMPIGEVVVEWAEGGAERAPQALFQEVEEILARAFTAPSPKESGANEPSHTEQPTAPADTGPQPANPMEEVE